jgi:hypothetical protein
MRFVLAIALATMGLAITSVPPVTAQMVPNSAGRPDTESASAAGPIPVGGKYTPVAPPPSRHDGGWHFTLATYVISPTLGGKAASGTLLPPVQLNLTASEVFAHPQIGGALYLQATKGPWSIALDGTYVDREQPITAEYQFIGTICTPIGGGGAVCGAGPDSSRVTGSMTATHAILEGLVFRRISGPIEVMIGATGSRTQTSISATVPTYGSGGPGFFTMVEKVKSSSEEWGDPVIGARWTPLDDTHWHVLLFGDAGGLSNSNWTWQVLPSVGYRFSNVFELALQYRALSTNYTTGSGKDTFKYNITLVGPQLGLAVHL